MGEPEECSDLWVLTKMRQREHIVAALALAQQRWREVLEIVAGSTDPDDACSRLAAEFGLDEIQVVAVADMQWRRLTESERVRFESELTELRASIAELERTAGNHSAAPKESGFSLRFDSPE
jgi:DNA gyrase/topoisomerase IV subunit A